MFQQCVYSNRLCLHSEEGSGGECGTVPERKTSTVVFTTCQLLFYLNALHKMIFLNSHNKSMRRGTVPIPILERWKLRYIEIK